MRRTSIYKGLATFHIQCSRNCQWDERRSLGVQALASNPLQAAAVGNVAVVSVAERYVLLSWTQVNVFVKPDEQWWACSVIAMARKRRMKSNVFVKPNGQNKFTCILPWREKVHEMTHSMRYTKIQWETSRKVVEFAKFYSNLWCFFHFCRLFLPFLRVTSTRCLNPWRSNTPYCKKTRLLAVGWNESWGYYGWVFGVKLLHYWKDSSKRSAFLGFYCYLRRVI